MIFSTFSSSLLMQVGKIAATFIAAGFVRTGARSPLALTIGLARAHASALADLRIPLRVVVPALLGIWIGQRVRGPISADRFRRWFITCLLAPGIQLIARPFV